VGLAGLGLRLAAWGWQGVLAAWGWQRFDIAFWRPLDPELLRPPLPQHRFCPVAACRALMRAISSALQCVSNVTSADVMTQQQCTVTALSATPTLLINTFSPSCSSLSESACRTRPGCTLKPHGDHSDCVQSRAYVAEYLGGGAYAANVQAKVRLLQGTAFFPAIC
jgi:hypothetical protein